MQIFIEFGSMLIACCKGRTSTFVRQRSVLSAFHTIQHFACCMHFCFKKPTKTFPKRRPNPSKIDAQNMLLFLSSVFFRLWPRFENLWASKLEPSWLSWTPMTLPKAFKIQSFGSTRPRCFPRGSKVAPKGIPRKAQSSIFGGFWIDFGAFSRYFFL